MAEKDLVSLIRLRGGIKHKLTNFVKFVNDIKPKIDTNEADINKLKELTLRVVQAQDLKLEFEELQTQIELTCDEIDLDKQYGYRDEFTDTLLEYLAIAQLLLDATNIQSSPNAMLVDQIDQIETMSVASANRHTSLKNVKLPVINLPKFSGDYNQWLEFKDTFSSLIHENTVISAIQKYHYLKASLSGEAMKTIQSLEVSTSNYETAWDLLCSRFNNKRLLVHNHLKALFELPVLKRETASGIRSLINSLREHLRALETLDQPTVHWDTMIIFLVTSKLDRSTAEEWEKHRLKNEFPKIDELSEFLSSRADWLEALETNHTTSKDIKEKKISNSSRRVTLTSTNVSCHFCKQPHTIYYCKDFLKLNTPDRISKIKELNLCQNCLSPGHNSKNCKSRFVCKKCKQSHNTLLHLEGARARHDDNNAEASISSSEGTSLVSFSQISYEKSVILATAIVDVYDIDQNVHSARILLDSGSQSNFVSEGLVKLLNLPLNPTNITVAGFNSVSATMKYKTTIRIKSRFESLEISPSCLVFPRITGQLPSSTFDISSWKLPTNIELADPKFNQNAEIDILLGSGYFWRVLLDQTIKLGKGLPSLHKTSFGWIVSGSLNRPVRKSHCCFSKLVEENIKRFWEVEEITRDVIPSSDDVLCENHFLENVKRDNDNRFIVKIPFKISPTVLGDSRESAIRRLLNLEHKFQRNPEFKKPYVKFMNEYLELNHMSIDPDDSELSYYLPHHGVLKHESTTTKLRVVFDGSAKTTSDLSLNDLQFVGPPIQNNIFDIVVRFRQYNVVVSSDIEKMYRQVLVNEDDRCFQKILWRQSPEQPIQTFRLNTITYGLTSAPFLAIRCLRLIAQENLNTFPESSSIIMNDFYVDDLLTGFSSEIEALKRCKEIKQLLDLYHFPLRKWHSNTPYLLQELQDVNDPNSIIPIGDNSTKTLGIMWNSSADTLTYKVPSFSENPRITKRIVLSDSSKIYDPLGLISPCIIMVKMLIQRLWSLKLTWDEPIPNCIAEKWLRIRSSLTILSELSVSRQAVIRDAITIEMHGFCDASQNGYGACIYVRSVNNDQQVETHLLCAKTKVAPLKVLTIPRLELCSALLLTNLMHQVKVAVRHSFDTYYWTDSEIVLAWLRTPPHRLQTFVSNRVSQIITLSNVDSWQRVRSKENPADPASRGLLPEPLRDSILWWQGPHWLRLSRDFWPISSPNVSCSPIPELRKQDHVCFSTVTTCINFTNYSNLSKLKNIIAYCLRFASNCRTNRQLRQTGVLTVEELDISLKRLVIMAQREDFAAEILILQTPNSLKARHKLIPLAPFIEQDGLLRVGGRLRNASLPYESRHPLLLNRKHYLARLILEHEHIQLLHAGPQLMISHSRLNFWITKGLQLAKKIVRNCLTCFKFRPRNTVPLMGDLPAPRVVPSLPFTNTGIDYGGPFLLKDRKGRFSKTFKAYICLFICFSTKAIHIELVTELTTQCFMECLMRFSARRGKPKHLYSDNGTNFRGAYNEIQRIKDFFGDANDEIIKRCAKESIIWHFIPPNSPHFGGLWEAGIKGVKGHLLKIIGNTVLTYENFLTILTNIESILNSRPLHPLSTDPHDLEALTPFHFLIGRANTEPIANVLSTIHGNKVKNYHLLKQTQEQFWHRWSKDYLLSLQRRHKWSKASNALTVGTMVLLQRDNLPTYQWPLGRIESVHRGADGHIRVVNVKTACGMYKRSVTKVFPLPVNDEH